MRRESPSSHRRLSHVPLQSREAAEREGLPPTHTLSPGPRAPCLAVAAQCAVGTQLEWLLGGPASALMGDAQEEAGGPGTASAPPPPTRPGPAARAAQEPAHTQPPGAGAGAGAGAGKAASPSVCVSKGPCSELSQEAGGTRW